jgi:hypothetical protein
MAYGRGFLLAISGAILASKHTSDHVCSGEVDRADGLASSSGLDGGGVISVVGTSGASSSS